MFRGNLEVEVSPAGAEDQRYAGSNAFPGLNFDAVHMPKFLTSMSNVNGRHRQVVTHQIEERRQGGYAR